MKVLLLHNVVPPEANKDELDNLEQARAIEESLTRLGHAVRRHAFSYDLGETRRAIDADPPELVFNLVESVEGNDRLIHFAPALLDTLGVPYTGVPTEAMFLTTGKLLAKRTMRAAGLPTAPWLDVANPPANPVDEPFVPGRYIVKSIWEHASFCLDASSIVDAEDAAALRNAIALRSEQTGSECFGELFIEGREFNLSLLGAPDGPRIFPPAEILFVDYPEGKPRILDYHSKWDEETPEYQNTPRTFDFAAADAALLRKLETFAKQAWSVFGLRGYARVDFRVGADGRPMILEINANPCLTPDAGFAAACERAGVGYDELIAGIVQDARFAAPVAES